jgi:hypothetical protein
VTSLTLAAVVMTLSGVPRPSQIRWCLLPVLRRSTGDGPVSDAVQCVEDAGLLPPLPPAPAGLPGAEPQLQRQQLPGYVVVQDVQMSCRHNRSGTGRGPGDRSGQGGSSGSISAHTSSTIHGRVLTPHERPNHPTGHARPGHFNKIVLRALSTTTTSSSTPPSTRTRTTTAHPARRTPVVTGPSPGRGLAAGWPRILGAAIRPGKVQITCCRSRFREVIPPCLRAVASSTEQCEHTTVAFTRPANTRR